MSDHILEISRQLMEIEEKLVKEQLSKLGIGIDWELEKTRRFPSLCIVQDGSETRDYYYNDGSATGLLVVSVTHKVTPTGITVKLNP